MTRSALTPYALLRILGTCCADDIAWLLGVAPEAVYPDLVAAEARGAARLVVSQPQTAEPLVQWETMEEPARWKHSQPTLQPASKSS